MSSWNGLPDCSDAVKAEAAVQPLKRAAQPPACDYAEGLVWEELLGRSGGWQCLHGCYCRGGVSIEWHDFDCDEALDWARSFHPESLELCLNLSGCGRMSCGGETREFGPMTVGFYYAEPGGLEARRLPGERHRFLTIEYSRGFLEQHLEGHKGIVHPVLNRALKRQGDGCRLSGVGRLAAAARKRLETMRQPPASGAATGLWYQGQALSYMAEHFLSVTTAEPKETNRQKELARGRVERAVEILKQRLDESVSLAELGKQVGCSPYYLSRTFSKEMGVTIAQYRRQLRLEHAAELLKSGKFNVTEAALEVGYSSLSHFSQAFCDVIGCCPGLYPLGITGSRPQGLKDRAKK